MYKATNRQMCLCVSVSRHKCQSRKEYKVYNEISNGGGGGGGGGGLQCRLQCVRVRLLQGSCGVKKKVRTTIKAVLLSWVWVSQSRLGSGRSTIL